jgi:putative membrane protein
MITFLFISSFAGDHKDSTFIKEAGSAVMMEVELGKLAQNKAASDQVRDFGRLMEQDHGKSGEELKKVTGKKEFTIIDNHQYYIEKLTVAGAGDFDKMYMEMMVADHEEDIEKFEEALKTVEDTELKAWIDKNLPVLKEHLNIAQNTLSTLENQQASDQE